MKRKKVTALLMAAAMILGTTACGNSQSGREDKTEEDNTPDKKESSQENSAEGDAAEITLLMTNDWVDESTELGAEFTKTIRQYEEERRSRFREPHSRISRSLSRRQHWQEAERMW